MMDDTPIAAKLKPNGLLKARDGSLLFGKLCAIALFSDTLLTAHHPSDPGIWHEVALACSCSIAPLMGAELGMRRASAPPGSQA